MNSPVIVQPGGPEPAVPERIVERNLALAFAPLHKAAFGIAMGAVAGIAVFLITAAHLLLAPEEQTGLQLLAQYFAGYELSWTGALIGAAWGGFVGFVAGWFCAFTRNLIVAVWLLIVRARADMEATRDFLDHI